MAYCTLDDIKKMIPEITIIQLTDDEDTGEIVESRVDEAIEAADAEIDSYCAGRYSVPFETVPPLVKKLSVDLAVYNLYARKVESVPEAKKDRYNNAMRALRDVAAGRSSLMAGSTEVADTGGPESTKSASDRIFTKDTMENF